MTKTAHCHVKGGSYLKDRDYLFGTLAKQNFLNQIDVIVPTMDAAIIGRIVNNIQPRDSYHLKNCTLFQLLKFLIFTDLTTPPRELLNLMSLLSVSKNGFLDEDSMVSIKHGKLNFTMSEEIYHKSGLHCKQTFMSRGNKNLKTKMYKCSFRLNVFQQLSMTVTTPTTPIESKKQKISELENKNHVRFLWFIENVLKTEYCFVVSCLPSTHIHSLLSNNSIITTYEVLKIDISTTKFHDLKSPHLNPITKDESWLCDTVEWLSYLSLNGKQLLKTDTTDEYISKYPLQFDNANFHDPDDDGREMNGMSLEHLTKITFKGNLLAAPLSSPSDIPHVANRIVVSLKDHVEWLGLLQYGVKDVNVSYGMSNEHNSNGENVDVMFIDKHEFVIWEIVGSGDSH